VSETQPPGEWRVLLDVQTEDRDGVRRRMLLDLPRQDFELPMLHELVRDAAEAGNVLTEETADLDVRVTFPEDMDATLKARFTDWCERVKTTVWPPEG